MREKPNLLKRNEEEIFADNLKALEAEGKLGEALRTLIEHERLYIGTEDEGKWAHEEIQGKLTKMLDYMESHGLTDEIQHVHSEMELLAQDVAVEKDAVDIEWEFTNLWNDHDRVGAIELALDRPVNSSEIQADAKLQNIYLMTDPSDALLSLRLIKDQVDRDKADIEALGFDVDKNE